MAIPPSRGIGWRWTFRGPGRSTIPTRNANCRTGTVRPSEATRAIVNASRPETIRETPLALRQAVFQGGFNVGAIFRFIVPLDGALKPVAKGDLGLPSEKFFGARIIGDAIERAGGHIGTELDL